MFHYSSKRLLFSEVEAIFNLSLMNVLEFNDHKIIYIDLARAKGEALVNIIV